MLEAKGQCFHHPQGGMCLGWCSDIRYNSITGNKTFDIIWQLSSKFPARALLFVKTWGWNRPIVRPAVLGICTTQTRHKATCPCLGLSLAGFKVPWKGPCVEACGRFWKATYCQPSLNTASANTPSDLQHWFHSHTQSKRKYVAVLQHLGTHAEETPALLTPKACHLQAASNSHRCKQHNLHLSLERLKGSIGAAVVIQPSERSCSCRCISRISILLFNRHTTAINEKYTTKLVQIAHDTS